VYGYKTVAYVFADSIAFVCIYVAERVPSAIDKFLVHLLRKEERQGEMGGERDRGREWRVKGRVWRAGMGMHEK